MVTIFESIHKTDKPFHISIDTALERVRNGKSRNICEEVRRTQTKAERNVIKKKLPAVCFSGSFSKRSADGLVAHSGFICIDFDGFKDQDELDSKRFELEFDSYTYACFISPSGDGLKVLVKIPQDEKNHKGYFEALADYYASPNFDMACSDVSRVCYESYDPNIYIDKESDVWTKVKEKANTTPKKISIPLNDDNKTIEYLKRWWNKDYGLVSGARNKNIFILAAAYNQYGIPFDTALSSICEYEQSDFPASEITTAVRSAYKNNAEFNTKKFEDEDKVNIVTGMLSKSIPAEVIKEIIPDVTDEIIETITDKVMGDNFWTRNNKGSVDFVNHKYRDFLTANGYYKYYPSNSQNFVFVRVLNNIMADTTDNGIRDFVFEYLDDNEDMSVYDAYAEKIKLGKEEFLSLLPTIDPKVLRDDKDNCYLYYKNCALRISSNKVEQIPYPELNGYIWTNQKVDRKFVKTSVDDCEYRKFIHNIAGNDEQRILSMESTIGFLLHSFKPAGFCPAVILNDETISDNPEGGTGKGIFVSALSHLKKNVTIDGKGFSFQKAFTYQRVSADTQIMTFQDIEKNFNFEKLFSVVTDGITVEKKNKQEIYIPFEESPKILITTNYAVKGSGNSFERRKWELELAQYYRKEFTPADEFGHQLFSDWKEEEWLKFDNYMIGCLQLYLQRGLIESPFKNLAIRKLEASTSPEFREWVLGNDMKYKLGADIEYVAQDIMNDFCEQYPDYGPMGKIKISHRTFYRWMHSYAMYRYGCPFKEARNMMGKTITFVETKKQIEINYVS